MFSTRWDVVSGSLVREIPVGNIQVGLGSVQSAIPSQLKISKDGMAPFAVVTQGQMLQSQSAIVRWDLATGQPHNIQIPAGQTSASFGSGQAIQVRALQCSTHSVHTALQRSPVHSTQKNTHCNKRTSLQRTLGLLRYR